MLELAILGLLSEENMHGYELKKRISTLHGPSPSVSFGSLYPALNRLERAGSVQVQTDTQTSTPHVPMTGSLSAEARAFRKVRRRSTGSRRSRKVYGITEAGRARLAELLNDDASDDRVFPLKLAFLSHLRVEGRSELFSRRRRFLENRMDDARRSHRDDDDTDRYRRALLKHHVDVTAFELGWLDQLIQSESAETLSTTPDSGGTP